MPEFSLTKIEEKIQKFWEANKIFEKSLESRKRGKKFVFYEGPPTANGMPHIGHFETRAFKDLFVRYKTMAGFFVPRRAGWDTHGLPVEIEVEKMLGFSGKRDIERYGVAKFNKQAKESVWKYKAEWEKFSKRIGFWLDFDNPYITYANDYIEKLWQIVKQFDKKKLLYKDYKVVPYCPRCGTPLSSHEVALGYENITENSVYLKFKVKPNKPNWSDRTYILSWTTTPWTLPGNVALAVGEKIDYVVIEKEGERFIVAKDLVEKVFGSNISSLKSFKGKDLVGLEYEPLFDVPQLKSANSYKIYAADFVTTEEGTGVIHTAVMYGEDDFNLGEEVRLPKFHTVDPEGNFIKGLGYGLDGLAVKSKQAEEKIISYLKDKSFLFKEQEYSHDYPFCWRCKHPLLYYAIDSWFVKTTAVKNRLIANNKKISWIPSYIKEGRFGQWLKEVKDWAFSRDRYWGTPLPVWECQKCENKIVIGDLEDLEKHRFKTKNEYYTLRHGHSTKNRGGGMEDLISSKLENDKYHLTDKGKDQIHKLAKKIKKLGIDLIITSPFIRTRETAGIIADELGKEVLIDDRVMEFQHGSMCEGKEEHICEMHFGKHGWETRTPDGESWKDLKKRTSGFLRDIDSQHRGKKILIVSHGDPIWTLEDFTLGLTGEQAISVYEKIYPDKGELRKIDLKNHPYDENGDLDLHRPYIDEVLLKCPKCGSEMHRVLEVIDVWFDSGAMPFASQKAIEPIGQISPISQRKNNFPADFICEAVDQTRGWFYTLLAVSTLLGKTAPYKNVISLGHVLDKDGKKMSKSLGNVITPDHAIEKFGADPVRWWFYRVNQAGEPKSFREEDLKEIENGFVRVIVNSVRFWRLYSDKTSRTNWSNKSNMSLFDRWLLSKWHNLVDSVTRSLDEYDATAASRLIERFVIEDLSNWWIRRSREKFQLANKNSQKDLLRFVLLELAKLIAPFVPFLAEYIHEELHRRTGVGKVSVHLHDWPKANKEMIDEKLESEMELVRQIVSLGLAARKEKNVKVRQPLSVLSIRYKILSMNEELADLIKEEVNVKEVIFKEGDGEMSVVLDTEITPDLRAEGLVREFMRMIQDARKDADYEYNQKVEAFWFTEDRFLKEAISRESEFIKQKTVLKDLRESRHDPKMVYDVERESELESGRIVWLGLKK